MTIAWTNNYDYNKNTNEILMTLKSQFRKT